jgi:hypothetical protein
MPLKYAKLENVTARLAGRITVLDTQYTDIIGVTGTSIGYNLINIIGQSVEEFMDMYLGMVYVMPLVLEHAFLSSIAEKLIVAEIYISYFPTGIETPDNTDSFSSVFRNQALNDFQCLFNGLGIFVPGVEGAATAIPNDETRGQMQNKALILQGETVKKFIGYDIDDDGIADTDLFKSNTNISTSFYEKNEFDELDGEEIINNVRVRERYAFRNRAEVDFYGF